MWHYDSEPQTFQGRDSRDDGPSMAPRPLPEFLPNSPRPRSSLKLKSLGLQGWRHYHSRALLRITYLPNRQAGAGECDGGGGHLLSPPGLTSCFCEMTDLFLPFRDLTHQRVGETFSPQNLRPWISRGAHMRKGGWLPATSGELGQ